MIRRCAPPLYCKEPASSLTREPPLLPIAAGVAILRHRLYDIDLLVNRTAVYGSVSVALVSAFVLANVVLQRLVESATGGQRSELLTAALGVAVGLSFGPL